MKYALALLLAGFVALPALAAEPPANPNAALPAPAEPAVSAGHMPRPPMAWQPANAMEPRAGMPIDTIVLHHTVIDGPAARTAGFFARPGTVVSAHYVVGKDGAIIQCVPDALLAHHAGVSFYKGRARVNRFSLGIEIVNLGDGVDPYPDAQYHALAGLLAYLMTEHHVGWDRVTGHKDIARPLGRKDDPSPNFDYARLKTEVEQALVAQHLSPSLIAGDLDPDVRRNAEPALPPITDKRTRIAIVGAGVAGLVSAYDLSRLGFKDITLYEANDVVGGKVKTYFHPKTGRPYEVGAIVQSDDFKNIYQLAKDTGYAASPQAWLVPYPLKAVVVHPDGTLVSRYVDYHERRPGSALRYTLGDDIAAVLPFLHLGSVLSDAGVLAPGFETLLDRAARSPRDQILLNALYQPTDQFLAKAPGLFGGSSDLSSLLGRFSLFFNMTGYGFTQEVPALYHAKFLPMVTNTGLAQIAFHSSGMTNARDGYQALFAHVARWLVQRGVHLHLGERVLAAKRLGDGPWGSKSPVRLATAAGPREYDALIVATSPQTARQYLLDGTPLEHKMLAAVKSYNFVTSIFEADPALVARYQRSTALVEDYGLDARTATAGRHVVGIYNNDGSNVFTAYQFAPPDATDASVQQALEADVSRLGGHVSRVLVIKQWRDYFPHYDCATLTSDGGRFLPEILDLQGQRNTLFVTANYNFESTEHTAGFAHAMIHRFFR